MKIFVNDYEHNVPSVFRARLLEALAHRGGAFESRRIFPDKDGLLGAQIHVSEWLTPSLGDRFQIITNAIGPGGDDSDRVKLIHDAIEAEPDLLTEACTERDEARARVVALLASEARLRALCVEACELHIRTSPNAFARIAEILLEAKS